VAYFLGRPVGIIEFYRFWLVADEHFAAMSYWWWYQIWSLMQKR